LLVKSKGAKEAGDVVVVVLVTVLLLLLEREEEEEAVELLRREDRSPRRRESVLIERERRRGKCMVMFDDVCLYMFVCGVCLSVQCVVSIGLMVLQWSALMDGVCIRHSLFFSSKQNKK
jgi:hypothetical protein